MALVSVWLLAGCGAPSSNSSNTAEIAARVNGTTITIPQLNAATPQATDGSPDVSKAKPAAVLQHMVAEELLVQQARKAEVDRDPQVMLAMEEARRAVLAEEWLRRAMADVPRPTDQEVRDYFNRHSEIFSGRREFRFQLAVLHGPATEVPKLQEQLGKAKNFDSVLDGLRASNREIVVDHLTRTSEQIPAGLLHRLSELKEGDAVIFPEGDTIDLVQLVGARPQPINEAQARPSIENSLMTQQRQERAEETINSLRAAAKIELTGDFRPPPSNRTDVAPAENEVNAGIAEGIK